MQWEQRTTRKTASSERGLFRFRYEMVIVRMRELCEGGRRSGTADKKDGGFRERFFNGYISDLLLPVPVEQICSIIPDRLHH